MSKCPRLRVLVEEVEDVHDPCFSSESKPTCHLPDEVVDCAIIAPSPFLSKGVSSIEDEPPVDSP